MPSQAHQKKKKKIEKEKEKEERKPISMVVCSFQMGNSFQTSSTGFCKITFLISVFYTMTFVPDKERWS